MMVGDRRPAVSLVFTEPSPLSAQRERGKKKSPRDSCLMSLGGVVTSPCPLLSCVVGRHRCHGLRRRGGTIIRPACVFLSVCACVCVTECAWVCFLLILLVLLLHLSVHPIFFKFNFMIWAFNILCYYAFMQKCTNQLSV